MRPRGGIRPGGFCLFLGLVVLAPGFNCAPDHETTASAGLAVIPAPNFATMEPGVREQLESAQERLDEALARAGSEPCELSRLLGRQGQLYLAYSFELAAQACFRNAGQLAPGDFRWSYYLGNLLRRSGKGEESRDHYERVLQLNPDYLPAAVALADLYMEANLLDEAGKVLDQVREKEASHAAVLVRRGQLASLRNDYDKAIQYLEAALELDPRASAVFYPLGLAYRALGELEKARYFVERQGARKASLADPLLEELADLAGGARSLQTRGNEAYRQGRLDEALEAYRQAVEAAPDNGEFRVNLAAVLSKMDDLDGAAGHLRQALRLDPRDALGHFNLAAVLARQGYDREALEHYDKAIALRPDYKNAHFNLANALLRLGRSEVAAAHFGRVLELEPGNAAAMVGRALALMQLEEWEAAADMLQEGYAARPDHHALALAFARLLAACPLDELRDGPRALAIARQVAAADHSASSAEVVAMALAEVGRFEEAVQLQEKILAAAQRQRLDAAHLRANLEGYRERRPARRPLGEGI